MDNLISFVILLSFSMMVTSDGPKVCSEEDEMRLYPCGVTTSYNTFTTDSGVELKMTTLAGQYCLVQSVTNGLDPRSWDDARQFCRAQGWELAELVRFDVATYLMGGTSAEIWLGGYRVESNAEFIWSRSKNAIRNGQVIPWANLQPSPPGGGRLCVSYLPPKGRADIDCETKMDWVCEGLEADYYKTNLTAIPRNTWKYKVGEKIRLVCSYRSRQAGSLIISGHGPDYEVQNNKVNNALSGTYQIYHLETEGPNYIYDGARCFATYSISVWLNANMRLHNARVRCCPKPYTCADHNLEITQEPIKPIVAVDSNPNTNTILFNSVVNYTCFTRLALGMIMTVSVTCSNKLWTIAFYMDGTIHETGELCINNDVITAGAVQGNDMWWGGNHMNFTFKFRAVELTKGIQISCSSSDVRYKAGNTTELAHDPLTVLRTLTLVYAIDPTLLADFPPVNSDGEIPVYGCDTVKASCFAVTNHGGQLVFVVILPSGNRSWSSNDQDSSTLPQWVAITEVTGSFTKDDEPTLNISMDIYVTEETAKAGYECITQIGTFVFRSWITNKFTYKIGSLPPKLEASNYTADDGLQVVSLNCTTNVGTGSTQTWKLLDYNGEEYYWFVSTNRTVEGLSQLPLWLGISVVTDNEESGCGTILTTNVTVRLLRYHLGLTFTCYSVDLGYKFTSKYTLRDLAASYQVMDEGVRRAVDNNILSWSTLFPVIVGTCGCCVLVAAICMLFKKHSSDKIVSEVSSQSVTLLEPSFDDSGDVFADNLNASPLVVKDTVESSPVDLNSFRSSSKIPGLSTSVSVLEIEPSSHKIIGRPSDNLSSYSTANTTVHPDDSSTTK